MEIRVMKKFPEAVLPQKAHDDDAGWDITACRVKQFGDLYVFDTGLILEIPTGYFGAIYARSSIMFTGMEKVGGVCVVDSGYRESISVIMRRVMSDYQLKEMRRLMAAEYPGKLHLMSPYKVGDRIAQLIIQPCVMPVMGVRLFDGIAERMAVDLEPVNFVETDHLSPTERGTCGYGSTGR